MRARTASFSSCAARVPGRTSPTVVTSAIIDPTGSEASFSRIFLLRAGTCSGVSASMRAPAMFILPPNTAFALFDHSPAPV